MRQLLSLLLSALLLVSPSWAAYTSNGSDNISAANDAVVGINVDNFSWSCIVNITTGGASLPEQIITHASTLAGGNFRMSMEAIAPVTAGYRLEFGEGFSGQAFSLWVTNADLSTGTTYQIGVDYNSSAASSPVLVVDGASVASTVASAPSGTRLTGTDSLRLLEDLGLGSDVLGSVAECAFWNRRLAASEWAMLGARFSPLFLREGLVYYMDLIGTAQDRRGNTGALTVTGAVVSSHPRMMYPAPTIETRKITVGGGGGGNCAKKMLLMGVGC